LISSDFLVSAKHCFFVIELHEIYDKFFTNEFIAMCRETHSVEILDGLKKRFPCDDFLNKMSDNERVLLMSEGRQYSMQWIVLSPKAYVSPI
jgi:hypothetical protein